MYGALWTPTSSSRGGLVAFGHLLTPGRIVLSVSGANSGGWRLAGATLLCYGDFGRRTNGGGQTEDNWYYKGLMHIKCTHNTIVCMHKNMIW
jgi:hypothetical protein